MVVDRFGCLGFCFTVCLLLCLFGALVAWILVFRFYFPVFNCVESN